MRDLDWDGGRNLRDLGGLPTPLSPTGATVAGRVARGARRELITTKGWLAAAEWGIRSIVDLRSPAEVGPHDGDASDAPPDVDVVLAPTEDQTHPEFRAACLPILDSPEYWQHNVRILPGHVRGALEAIAAVAPGTLVHCAAGRDRTGMVSALLLANAGVSPDDVVADYAVAVRTMAGAPAHGGPGHDRQAAWCDAEVATFLDDNQDHVRLFAAAPQNVLDRLSVTDETRSRLRALLTEP